MYDWGAYSTTQLDQMRKRYRDLSVDELIERYRVVWEMCRLDDPDKLPMAMAIQDLVQLWRELARRK